ncbi:MAG: hypothetical protein ACRCWG_14940 [Sarcina sp.]
MLNIFKEKQVQINLIDAGILAIGILLIIFSDTHGEMPDITNIPVYIVLAIGVGLLAVLNHFAHELLGKRIFLYGFNFIGILILCYTYTFDPYGLVLFFGVSFILDYIYKKFIDPK